VPDADCHVLAAVFDRVAKQVLEQRFEATLVSVNRATTLVGPVQQFRTVCLDIAPSLFGDRRECHSVGLADCFPLASQRQHVLDDPFYSVVGVPNLLEAVFVPFLLEQFETPLCNAERVPKIVAEHARELLEAFVLAFEFALALFALGDVPTLRDEEFDIAVIVCDGRDRGVGRYRFVATADLHLEPDELAVRRPFGGVFRSVFRFRGDIQWWQIPEGRPMTSARSLSLNWSAVSLTSTTVPSGCSSTVN